MSSARYVTVPNCTALPPRKLDLTIKFARQIAVQLFFVHATKMCFPVSPLILTLGTKWTLVVNFYLRPFYFQEELLYPFNKRFVWPQSPSVCFGEKKSCSCPQFRTPDPPSHSLVTVPSPAKHKIQLSHRIMISFAVLAKEHVYRRQAVRVSSECPDFLKRKYNVDHG